MTRKTLIKQGKKICETMPASANCIEDLIEEEKRKRVLRILTTTKLKLKDPGTWALLAQKNLDPYGYSSLQFAKNWGKLMQYEIEINGKPLDKIAQETFKQADENGYGELLKFPAVSILKQTWTHGTLLKKWFDETRHP